MGKRIKQFGKKLFLSAGVMVSAAMLGSCAGDSISVQPAGQDVQGQQGAVGFDAYLSRATSRNGAEGELTPNTTGTGKVSLEGKGFGVFAYYTDNADYDGHSIPNFMWNQQVAKDATAGWTYSPVKYWPNEFGSAEAEEADRVSFFAYAPYVDADVASGKTAAATGEAEGTGITAFSRNNATGDPLVKYVVNLDPKRAVDLCWGTVDQNRDWTKANKKSDGTSETQPFTKGMPWLNVERPSSVSADGSKVKFQFEHALSQLNIQVKNDVDIASPEASPGAVSVEQQTRVWIRSITLSGFSTMGALNLNNTAAGKAKWLDYYDSREFLAGETLKVHDGRKDGEEGTAAAVNEQVTGINPALVQTDAYDEITAADVKDAVLTCATATSTGVTNTFQNVFSGAATGDGAAAAGDPIYVIPTGEAVKVTIAYDVETYSPNLATYLSDGQTRGASISNVITKDITLASGAPMTMENGKKYTIQLHLGLNSVKFDAAVSDWADGDEAEAGLPSNGPGVALSEATVGMFVGADGRAYASVDDAETAGTTAEAYIAYKSATAGESRAIALTNDVAFGTSWDAFDSNPGWGSVPNRTPIDNCIWQWPTKADFENMLDHLQTLSTDNGVLEDGCVYMSSTTHETNNARFWNLFFKPSTSEIRLGHNYKNGGDLNRTVRAVLAF